MRADLHIAAGSCAIVKKRFLLLVTTAAGSLCFAASSALGQYWTLTSAPSNAWVAVAASADCSKIAAVIGGGGIYNSLDGGTNWNLSNAPRNNWAAIACSTNGADLIAAVNGGGIWMSTNSGSSWLLSGAPSNVWISVACSADGITQVAGGMSGIWVSTNSGAQWNMANIPSNTYYGVACLSDGSQLVGLGDGGTFCASGNYGEYWSVFGEISWALITSAAEAATLAGASGNTVVIGNAWGWTARLVLSSPPNMIDVIGASPDGSRFLALAEPSLMYFSGNSGLTWIPFTIPGQPFSSVAISSQGSSLIVIAVANGGGIYIWQPMGPIITAQPENQTVLGATSTEMGVSVTAAVSPYYQWLFDGVAIPNATNISLTLTNIQLNQAGTYSVLVSNIVGFILSSNATLSVVPASLATETPDPSLYAANLLASITTGSSNTAVWFDWGLTTNYSNVTPAIILQGANAPIISNLMTGLTPYTTYHCQAVASNVFGTVLGGDVSFVTVPKFVQVATNSVWSALVLSGDGRELAATAGGAIYISTNLGLTFLPTTGTGSVFAISSNGCTILAASGSNIYASLDRGLTWTTNSAPTAFSCFAASSDAQKLAATDGSVNVYTSTNFGATWKGSTAPYSPTYGLTSSADGTRLYGISFPARETGAVFGSTNSGKTWASLGTFGAQYGLDSISCSADGSIILVGGETSFFSTNAGASWPTRSAPNSAPGPAASTASSASGHTLIVSTEWGTYVSPDTGNSWYMANPQVFLSGGFPAEPLGYLMGGVMSSADGNTLALITGDMDINSYSIFLSIPPPGQPLTLSVATNTYSGLPIFQLTGESGYNYIVQASTNLLNWTNIASVVNTNGLVPFTDPAWANYKQRFYRAVAP
jgi:photosystem II stability/assembly factor-like uncharacterized protein